jgi:Methyltransferase domain
VERWLQGYAIGSDQVCGHESQIPCPTAQDPARACGRCRYVVGVDRSPDALGRARFRAEQRGLTQVEFAEGNTHDPAPEGLSMQSSGG